MYLRRVIPEQRLCSLSSIFGHLVFCKLLDKFGFQTIFGRSDVQKILGLKPTRSTELLREMTKQEIIEPVTGHGKGKYRFKQ